LSEIIQTVLGVKYPGLKKVWRIYNSLISRFGSEYNVLLDAPFEEIADLSNVEIANAIMQVREERVKVIPGYDGLYGKIVFSEEKGETERRDDAIRRQRSISDYF
ncbi:hypothetical protein DRO64_01145, partial [Candidatus Bathyarchaeota archaeon]